MCLVGKRKLQATLCELEENYEYCKTLINFNNGKYTSHADLRHSRADHAFYVMHTKFA